jgi:hypothetical protein
MKKYLCWFAHGEPYVPYKTIVEIMVESTFSYSNVHKVLDDNSKYYREYGYGCKRMNQGYASECSIIDKEPNANAARFFELIKDFDEPL